MNYYKFKMTGGGSINVAADIPVYEMCEHVQAFQETYTNPAYWDAPKIVDFLNKRGVKAHRIRYKTMNL